MLRIIGPIRPGHAWNCSAGSVAPEPAANLGQTGQVNETLVAEIERCRFTPTRFREGYDMAEVDRFLDDLCARLRSGESVGGFIAEARFTPVRMREGYDMAAVDLLLQHVASSAAAVATGGSTENAPTDASPAAEDSTPADDAWRNPVSEVRSPLARLFQRRR